MVVSEATVPMLRWHSIESHAATPDMANSGSFSQTQDRIREKSVRPTPNSRRRGQ